MTSRAEHRQHVITEVELLHRVRPLESLAPALGYTTTKDLERSLRRWGRPDLIRNALKEPQL